VGGEKLVEKLRLHGARKKRWLRYYELLAVKLLNPYK
jgi:hypothetical protein